VAAIKELFNLIAGCWNLLNSANVVLLEKKEGAKTIGEYRPISIMHSVGKIVTEILANRLSPHLNRLVSNIQSAFIKDRSIHDNFQYVNGAVNHFHNSKTLMFLLKLDIAKVFDSVRWKYLIEAMEQLGFVPKWRDMMTLIWSTTSSRIMLNGIPGQPIKLVERLRQLYPLSPMLFILAMDPLQKLLDMATRQGLLTPIGANPVKLRTNLYADDAILFIRPVAQDISNLQQLLTQFGNATGLCTNIQKS
jgi:hypothetical protein